MFYLLWRMPLSPAPEDAWGEGVEVPVKTRSRAMGSEAGGTIAPHGRPVIAVEAAAVARDRHLAHRAAVPVRPQHAGERVGGPIRATSAAGAAHSKAVASPRLLPLESRMAVEAITRNSVVGSAARLDAETQAISVEFFIGGPATSNAGDRPGCRDRHHDLWATFLRHPSIGFRGTSGNGGGCGEEDRD